MFAGLVSTLISTLLADQSALDLLYLVYFELALAFVQIAAALKLVHMYFIHIQGSLFAHQISQWCPIPSQRQDWWSSVRNSEVVLSHFHWH